MTDASLNLKSSIDRRKSKIKSQNKTHKKWKTKFIQNCLLFDDFATQKRSKWNSDPKKNFIYVFCESILVRKVILLEKKIKIFWLFFPWRPKIQHLSPEKLTTALTFWCSFRIFTGFCSSYQDGWTYKT